MAEMEEMVSHLDLELKSRSSIKMNKFFMVPIVNVVWSLIAGARFASDDVKLHDLNQRIDDYFKSGNFGSSLMAAYPFLKDWVPSLCGFDKQHKANMAMNRFLEVMCSLHMHMHTGRNALNKWLLDFNCLPIDFRN